MEKTAPCPGQLGGMQSQFIMVTYYNVCGQTMTEAKQAWFCTLEEQKLSMITRMSVRREMHGAQRKGANEKRRGTRRKLWERWIFRGQAEKEEPTEIWFLPVMSEKEKLVSSFSHEDIGYLTCLWRNLYAGQEALISVTSDTHMTPP